VTTLTVARFARLQHVGCVLANASACGARARCRRRHPPLNYLEVPAPRSLPPLSTTAIVSTAVEDSRNRATGGSGLGLAVARSAARRHRGTLSLTARPAVG